MHWGTTITILIERRIASRSYDLVVLDIKMPDLNGFALYQEIKKFNKKIKVCFITAGEMVRPLHASG